MSIFSVRWVQGWEETVTAGFGNLYVSMLGGVSCGIGYSNLKTCSVL